MNLQIRLALVNKVKVNCDVVVSLVVYFLDTQAANRLAIRFL